MAVIYCDDEGEVLAGRGGHLLSSSPEQRMELPFSHQLAPLAIRGWNHSPGTRQIPRNGSSDTEGSLGSEANYIPTSLHPVH